MHAHFIQSGRSLIGVTRPVECIQMPHGHHRGINQVVAEFCAKMSVERMADDPGIKTNVMAHDYLA